MKKILFMACIVFSAVSTSVNAAYFDGFKNWLKEEGTVVNRGTRPRPPRW